MTRFRPCIDLHAGQVKQIVGSTLSDSPQSLKTNFVAQHDSAWYANLYQKDQLTGGHIIRLGPGNDEAARKALAAWPGGMQLGGGIDEENAEDWIEAGASHIIVTTCLFSPDGVFREHKLIDLSRAVGANRIVVDLSCSRLATGWAVMMNRWQTITSLRITHQTLDSLAEYCDEFLIHAADVEGKCSGIDEELVAFLGTWKGRPITYAGGIASLQDFDLIDQLTNGTMDATVGSALDIFGGHGIRYADLVDRQRKQS